MRKLFAIGSFIAIFAATVLPSQVANAMPAFQPTFTDTVSVTDYLGHPLAGASVALVYVDDSTQKSGVTASITTNEMGIAHLVGNTLTPYYGIAVTPAASDSDNATGFYGDNMWMQNYDRTIAVQLKRATAHVHIEENDGSDAKAGVMLQYPGTGQTDGGTYLLTARSGVVGIDLTDQIDVGHSAALTASQSNDSLAALSFLGVSVVGSGVGTVATLADANYVQNPIPQDETGAYILKFPANQVRGQLTDASGNVLPLPSGTQLTVRTMPANQDGSPKYIGDTNFFENYTRVAADGTFGINLQNLAPGEYFPNFSSTGSEIIGSFIGAPFWVLSDGSVSATADGIGESPATFLSLQAIPTGQPNLVLKTLNSDGSTAFPARYTIQNQDILDSYNQPVNVFTEWTNSGVASAFLTPGHYSVIEDPSDKRASFFAFNVTVGNDGTATAQYQDGSSFPATNGAFVHRFALSNVWAKVTNGSDHSVNNAGCLNFAPIGGGPSQGSCSQWSFLGYANLAVPDGQWDLWTSTWDGSGVDAHYNLTITGPDMAITDSLGNTLTAVDGFYSVPLGNPNLNIYFDTLGHSAPQANFEVQTLDSNGNPTGGRGYPIIGGQGHVQLDPGSYRIVFHLQDIALADTSYNATVASDGTVTIDGLTADSNGFFTLTAGIPNVTGTVHDPAGNDLNLGNGMNVNACLQQRDGNGNWMGFDCSGLSSSAFALKTPGNGTYRLHIDVWNSNDFGSMDSDPFTIDDQNPSVSLNDLRLTLVNVRLHFQLDGQPWSNGSVEFQTLDSNGTVTSGMGFGTGTPNFAFHLNAGNYRVVFHTQNAQFADNSYQATVDQTGTFTITGLTAGLDGFYTLTGATANVTATIVDPLGNPLNLANNAGVNVCLAKQDNNGNWNWNSCSNTRTGDVAIKTPSDGTYRLHIDIYGTDLYANSDSVTFTIDSQHPAFDFGNLRLLAPNLKLHFVANGQPTNKGWLEVQKDLGNNNWQWITGRGLNGSTAVLNLETGTYKLVYHTNSSSLADRTYSATVAQDGSVNIVGVTPESDSSFTLTGLTPNVSGSLVDSQGHALVLGQGQWINACLQKKDAYGNWQWVTCNSVQGGAFVFNTSENGTYRVRLEPYGTSDFAATNLDSFLIDDSNTNQVYGNVQLAQPNLLVKFAATGIINPSGWIQFEKSLGNNNYQWYTSRGFNSPIAENLPTGTYKVTVHIENAGLADGGYELVVASDGTTSITGQTKDGNGYYTLTGALPNVTGSVLSAFGTAIQLGNGHWVNACLQKKDGYGNWQWQGCTGLNNGGFAFRTSSDGTYRIHLDVQGIDGSTSTDLEEFTIAGDTQKTYGTVQLAAPNFKAHLTFAGQPLTSAYLEIQQSDGGGGWRWVNNSNSGTGDVSLNLAPGTYRAVLHANSSIAADRSYNLVVANDLSVTIVGQTADGVTGFFNLAAATPNVSMTVKDTNGQALPQYSTSVVLQKKNTWGGWDWLNWFNVDASGTIAASITDPGTYRFRIEPHNIGGAAVTTSGSFQINAPSDILDLGQVNLKAPNVQFTLLDPTGTPVPYTNVSLQFGNWWTNASSDQNGHVALFVDSDEVAAANTWATGTVHIHVTVDAPWDRTDITRFECNSGDQKALCQDLPDLTIGSAYPTVSLPDVSFAAPNVKIHVLAPNGSTEPAGAWVVLWKIVCDSGNPTNCHREWYAGSNTGQSGDASFNVPDQDAGLKFAVEVNPSWLTRSTEAQNLDDNAGQGYSLADIVAKSVSLVGSNLKLTVLQATAQDQAAMWTGIGIEQVDSNNNYIQWIAGYGTDNLGRAAIHLADGRYRINMYPNNGSKGTVTRCIVTVVAGVVTPVDGQCNGAALNGDSLTVKLSLGNLVGQVTDATSGATIEGAIIVATNSSDGSTMQTVSDANGNYGFQVNPGSSWDIKVIYVNPDPTAQAYDMASVAGVTPPWDGSQLTQNVSLARKA